MRALFLALALLLFGAPAHADTWGRADSTRTWALRLTPGQDPRLELERFARAHDIRAGYVVTCAGSLVCAALRLANQQATSTYDGHFEIVSLTGTVGTGGSHLHASLADSTGRVFGGHLAPGSRVYTTAEIVLGEAVGLVFERATDPATGYRELSIVRARPPAR